MQGHPQVIDCVKELLRGELAARDQYFVHSRQYEDQGYLRLYTRLNHEMEEETQHADVILRREHPLAGRTELTPADLAGEEWVATFDSTICRQWLRRLFDGVSNAPRIVHESMEFENHLELVRAGLGVALVPRMGRPPLHPDLVAIPTVQPASTRGVSAVHRRSQADSPALQAVLDAVRVGAAGPHAP